MTQEQYAQLYETCYMRVFSYAMTLAGNRSEAEEITQEAFFRAFTRRNDFRGEADESTWLCSIARNLFVDERRRQRRRATFPQEPLEMAKAAADIAVERDDSLRIHKALHEMEEPYREVFELRVFGELSFREIGMIFQKTENWARVTYHRARVKLQERMEKT